MDLQSIKSLTKFISAIGIGLSLFFFIPIICAFIYHEEVKTILISNLIFLGINFSIFSLLSNHPFKMGIKESILAVNLIWILLGIAGGGALYLTTDIKLADAFFEAISGFTTTGATIFTDIESLSHTTLMLRSLMHWLGGMGIIVLGVGLLTLINPTGSMTLFKAESTGIKMEKLTPKIKDTAIRLWRIYIFLTVIDAILLWAEGMSLFDAVNHAFSTISTGGFSTKNESLGFWKDNPLILWTTTVFMLLSGINFIAHLKFLKKDTSGYRSEEVKWYLIVFFSLSFTLTLLHLIQSNDSLFYSLTHSFFTISSILTTTGFASLDYEKWGYAATATIFVAMLIGGNAGSTAGGVKVIRYVVLFKNLFVQIKKILHPNAVIGIFVDNNKVSSHILGSVTAFFFLFALTNTALTLYLYAKGYTFMTSFSASIACIGNIGPGFADVGPTQNFSFFSSFDKVLLAIFMIIGRLEFYTFIILLTKDFWRKY
ncbi:TrkH family potassium uptake protein [Nitrosophilus labii]|uniref:TrkH family potassium uptake protein n=1 Tax=Nitrosophilus labii TaxID=2706014 RepID=UPI001656F0A0|nr:TrkH family potassium uptake protein [Nitrosophilus labii]